MHKMIGHNNPPLAERLPLDHAALLALAHEHAAMVPNDLRPIEDDDEAAAYTDTAAEIKSAAAAIVRVLETATMPDSLQTVRCRWARLARCC